MSTQLQCDPNRVAALTREVIALLANEDPAVSLRVMETCVVIYGGTLSGAQHNHQQLNRSDADTDSQEIDQFFVRDEKLRPSENAVLCVAYLYSQFGDAMFSLEDLREVAVEAGVTIPDRLDMTLKQSSRNGKKLFMSCGIDAYKATATARVYFESEWNVRAGKKPKRAKQLT